MSQHEPPLPQAAISIHGPASVRVCHRRDPAVGDRLDVQVDGCPEALKDELAAWKDGEGDASRADELCPVCHCRRADVLHCGLLAGGDGK